MVLEVGRNYVMDDNFEAETEGEIGAHKGTVVTVLEAEDPNNPGWIFVQIADKSGFVPSDYLVENVKQFEQTSQGSNSQQQQPSMTSAPQQQVSQQQSVPHTQIPPQQHHYHQQEQQQQQQQQQQAQIPVQQQYQQQPIPTQQQQLQQPASSMPPQAILGQQQTASGYYQQPQAAVPPQVLMGLQQGVPGYNQHPQQPQINSNSQVSSTHQPPLGSAVGAPPPPPPQEFRNQPLQHHQAPSSTQQGEHLAAEQRQISTELWQYREDLLNSTSLPDPPQRRWHYRDYFGDQQGPFNMKEMKERLEVSKVIKEDSKVLIELGIGEHAKIEEETLRDLFRAPEAAFVESPRLTRQGNKCWYFLKGDIEQGPFSNAQMKAWFDGGFFGGSTMVRLANCQTALVPLQHVYADPANAFQAPPMLPGFDPATFKGTRTKVLVRQPGMVKSAPEPANRDQRKVRFEEVPTSIDETDERSVSSSSNTLVGKSSSKKILYGGGFPEYQKLPSPHAVGKKIYSQALYHFVTRPLHPDAGTIQCFIRREIDGARVNFNKYILFLEETNTPILTAFRHYSGISSVYRIMLCPTGRIQDCNERALQIAALELNFSGSSFLLHNNVKGHQNDPRDMLSIVYEKNRLSNKGPRKMKVGVPKLEEGQPEFTLWRHEGVKQSPLSAALKAMSQERLIALMNKAPVWDERKKAYKLDFKGRVTRSSVKNFQLVDPSRDPENKNVIMQHGRTGVNRFSMDVAHPLSVVQAFAVALSSLHSKKAVD